jgi:hypothetical protein
MELKNFWITAANGAAVANPTATVYLPNSETLATGLVDKDGAALTNPFNGNDRGHVQFAAPDGRYDLKIVGGGREYIQRIAFSEGAATSFAQVVNKTENYALAAADVGAYIRIGGGGAVSITVAPNATLALPSNGEWHFRATGDVEFAPASGVTVNPPHGGTLTMASGMTVTLKRVAADVFDLLGQTVAE